jgi:6-phosphogluconolactonase (cycloisomerase 2 family)
MQAETMRPASHAFDGALSAYAVDGVSGALTEVQGSPFSATQGRGAIVFHPNGQFIFKGGGSISAFRFDPTSGALAEVAGSPVPGGGSDPSAIDVAIDPRGQYLYAVTTSTGLLRGYAIDPDSGALVEVPGSPFPAGPFPYSVGVDPSGRFVYVGNDDAAEVSGFSIDRVTGTLSPLAQSAFVADGLQPEFAFVAAD